MSRLLYRIARILLKHSPDKHYINRAFFEQEQQIRELIHQEITHFYEKLVEEHLMGVPIPVARNHYLMNYVRAGSEQRLWELLIKMEKYRLKGTFVDMSHYVFDLDSFYKTTIYSIWIEVLTCLEIKESGLAKYLKDYTNLPKEGEEIRSICNNLR